METSCATHLSASLSPPSLTWHRSHSQRTSSFGLGWYSDEGERVFILALKGFAVLPSCKLWVNTDSFFSDLWFTDYRNHRSVFGLVSHPHPTVQQQSCTSVWKYVICTFWAKRLRMFVRRIFFTVILVIVKTETFEVDHNFIWPIFSFSDVVTARVYSAITNSRFQFIPYLDSFSNSCKTKDIFSFSCSWHIKLRLIITFYYLTLP